MEDAQYSTTPTSTEGASELLVVLVLVKGIQVRYDSYWPGWIQTSICILLVLGDAQVLHSNIDQPNPEVRVKAVYRTIPAKMLWQSYCTNSQAFYGDHTSCAHTRPGKQIFLLLGLAAAKSNVQ